MAAAGQVQKSPKYNLNQCIVLRNNNNNSTHTHTHTYVHTYIHTCMLHAHIHAYIHTYIHKHTLTHTYTHIHTRTHKWTTSSSDDSLDTPIRVQADRHVALLHSFHLLFVFALFPVVAEVCALPRRIVGFLAALVQRN
jgi:hypothetical protein